MLNKDINSRDSNIELLRILCMFMVLLHHLMFYGPGIAFFSTDEVCFDSLLAALINPFVYCAVNTFVLISGYYGINFKIKGITRLYVQCAVIGLICYITGTYVNRGSIGPYGLSHNCIFALSNTRWFISTYLCLYLISPFLNKFISTISQKEYIILLSTLFAINVYLGWFWGNSVNKTGYSLSNFVFLYFIGQFLHTYYPAHNNHKLKYLSIYIIPAFFISVVVWFCIHSGKSGKMYVILTQRYNNPLLIIQSIGLLYFFLSANLRNNFINWCATSVLSVYLIHQNPYIDKWIHDFCADNFYSWSSNTRWLFLLLAAVLIFISCVIIDKILAIAYKPFIQLLTDIINKSIRRIHLRYSD